LLLQEAQDLQIGDRQGIAVDFSRLGPEHLAAIERTRDAAAYLTAIDV
jgi:hypothetical protein